MQIVSLDNATTAAGVEFTLNDIDVNKNGETRVAVLKTSNFDGKTLSLEVAAPGTANWYTTSVTFASLADAAVILLRANYKYRIVPSATGGALAVSLMFF
jgi:hypothetical protein